MKKYITVLTLITLVSSLLAFGKEKTISVESLNGKNEKIKVEVPYNPKKVAILDLATLDILDNLNLGDHIAGCATTNIEYLSKHSPDKNKKIKNIGNIKAPDMEAVFECEPDIIFIGGRLTAKYDELSKIAPVVYLSIDMDIGLLESIKKNAGIIASIFGKENEATEKIQTLESRIKKLNEKANGRTAVLGMVTSGSCNLLGNRGRLNLITREIGFTNLGANLSKEKNKGRKLSAQEAASQAHGEESSFELISKLNPEYIFILDRDSAIGTKGARLAKDVMENEIVSMTKAAKNGKLIILDYPAIWYTAEGGITSLEYMIKDLEDHI